MMEGTKNTRDCGMGTADSNIIQYDRPAIRRRRRRRRRCTTYVRVEEEVCRFAQQQQHAEVSVYMAQWTCCFYSPVRPLDVCMMNRKRTNNANPFYFPSLTTAANSIKNNNNNNKTRGNNSTYYYTTAACLPACL